ncbi:sulfatase-like hydrolase/transferase [Gilvimarinus sp. 1_MG-2023]|uniref:sulfatase-like hydrolase/transferase n=1 Tax=Gilvimarinus sp. 1_MG-2023 TaxID=3062638 RepID=UPI0026E3DD86|nr:sulfatase-like hydrolase/transferase [Gilvimarinus sp. 1_MG-2023]MDO6746396.1 sulfatase-like hydrolase/transferase [Gilvimarinus sp. 1_MG-2023]
MMVYFSALLTFGSALVFNRSTTSRAAASAIGFYIFLSLFLIGAQILAHYLTGNGIDESVYFHLVMSKKDAGLKEFYGLIAISLMYLLISALLSFIAYRKSLSKQEAKQSKRTYVAGVVLALASLALNPASASLTLLFSSYTTNTEGLVPPLLYKSPSIQEFNKKNIVYIYLESVERTYLNNEMFPGLTPNLNKLDSESLSFTNIQQVYGTGWTIAGKVSSQCGVPLITPGNGNSMRGMDTFLPKATCLGDILRSNGYQLVYMGGSSLKFAGKGNFYKSHGFGRVEGIETLKTQLEDLDYQNSWGLYDDSLFKQVKKRYDQLASRPEPFGLFTLTLDTHHPKGHVSSSCQNIVYGDGSNPILNAIHCTDKLVADLVNHIKTSPTYGNTILIIASDHLAMRNTAYSQLSNGNRKNLLLIMGSEITPNRNFSPGSLLDITPTLLDLLNADIESFGFGRSLIRPTPSLSETTRDINTYLASQRKFLQGLWSFPDIGSGFVVSSEQSSVLIQDRNIDYPALINLDENLQIVNIEFEFDSKEKLIEQVQNKTFSDKFIWIDLCQNNSTITPQYVSAPSIYCIVFGSLGSENNQTFIINQKTPISFSELQEIFKQGQPTAKRAELAREKLQSLAIYGEIDVEHYTPRPSLSGDYLLTSAGKQSTRKAHLKNLVNNTEIDLKQGITLYGFNKMSPPVELLRINHCQKSPFSPAGVNFQNYISRYFGFFGALAVTANYQTNCSANELALLFEHTGLTNWQSLSTGAPYIAILSSNGGIIEKSGSPQSSISINATNFIRPLAHPKTKPRTTHKLPRVAHAGGGYNQKIYTNSIDALNDNSSKYELFEIDFSWTSDGHLVCIHDWSDSYTRSFGLPSKGKVTLDEFKNNIINHSSVEKCTLQSLADWLLKNKHARIVTDIKEDNIKALNKIATDFPSLQQRFIPQIYQPLEYYEAKLAGYHDIIWSIYRYRGENHQIVDQIRSMNLYALTMPKHRARDGLGAQVKQHTGTPSYVHTVNRPEEADSFFELGIDSIYTDYLSAPLKATFSLRSAAYSAGSSYVLSEKSQKTVKLLRGLTLIGLSKTGELEKLSHYDSCGSGKVTDSVSVPPGSGFANTIARFQPKYDAFAILAHDSAECGAREVEQLLAGTSLHDWPNIKLRTPYIGVIFKDKQPQETFGERETSTTATIVVQ